MAMIYNWTYIVYSYVLFLNAYQIAKQDVI